MCFTTIRARLGILGLTALISACASTVQHDVIVYHDWPLDAAERSFRMVRQSGQEASLVHRTHERLVKRALLAAGFTQTPRPALEVSFEFHTQIDEVRNTTHWPVFWPYFSIGHRFRHGSLFFSGPLFWGAHYGSQTTVSTYETHHLTLQIHDLRRPGHRRIYEADASSSSDGLSPALAVPLLVEAVLADFPGESGIDRRISLPWPTQSKP